MSTIAISVNALARVKQTMVESLHWRTDYEETPLCFFPSFMGTHRSVFTTSESAVEAVADDFVRLAFLFNAEEYHRGKYAEINADPVEYGSAFYAIERSHVKRLGVFQLLKTLQMISYNTLARGWMTDEVYENWSYRDDYERFRKTISVMISSLAQSIVSRLPQSKEAAWCI